MFLETCLIATRLATFFNARACSCEFARARAASVKNRPSKCCFAHVCLDDLLRGSANLLLYVHLSAQVAAPGRHKPHTGALVNEVLHSLRFFVGGGRLARNPCALSTRPARQDSFSEPRGPTAG